MRGYFDYGGRLARFVFRRERLSSTVWILALALFSIALAPAMSNMFPDMAARNNFAQSFNNPIMIAMMGPVYGLDNYTAGAMYGGMMLLWYAITVAAMNVFLVVRHTRADEDKGRVEVIRSLPVGRLANVGAVLAVALAVNAALAALTGLGLAAQGVEGMDLAGSIVFGGAAGAFGFLFAAVTLLFCQLSPSAGGATGLSFATLGGFYMLRAAGDAQGNEFLACLSPLGLVQRSQAYVANRVWPVLVLLATALAVAAVACKLSAARDLGQGLFAAKPGRKNASLALRSSFGLAFRLTRAMLFSWLVVLFVAGASYGSVIADIPGFVGESEEYMTVIGVPVDLLETLSDADKESLIVDRFGAFVIAMMTLMCIVPILAAVLKARTEEKEGRAEQIVVRAVPRTKYLAGYAALSYAASVVLPCATAAGLYSVSAAVAGDANPFSWSELLKSFLVYLPALWVLIGIAILLIGRFPKAVRLVWGYFGVVCFTSFIGAMALPPWMLNISPLHHIPRPEPLTPFHPDLLPLAVLTIVAATATAVGLVAYGRRETAS